MTDQTSVGFGFQADVVNVGSLSHLITGRILKALSDGGVDFYAVSASMWLGKYIPVQDSLQTTVHSNLLARKGLNGFLAKALSIGWGHSAVPVEMSRTKAGTSALLLIGALSVGSSYYVAAQCLSELLTIYGCEANQAPNVDVLKPMIAYLAPFMQDFGFSKVLQHVTTSVSHQAVRLCAHVPSGFTTLGESPVLAAAIKQLIFTSERDESIYFVVHSRGAWMATFASHILGMAVEILLDDVVLWASAGSQGSVTFDLGRPNRRGNTVQLASQSGLHFVDVPSTVSSQDTICIDYALSESINCELGYYPSLTEGLTRSVRCAIVRLSSALLRKLRMRSSSFWASQHCIGGYFLSDVALLETFHDFGLGSDVVEDSLRKDGSMDTGWAGTPTEVHGLSYLNSIEAGELKSLCHIHQQGNGKLGRCICCHIGGIVHGFASTIVSLVQCRYGSTEIRIRAEIVNGKANTAWSRGCILENGECEIPLNSHQLFSHLSELVHCVGSEVFHERNMLDVSANKSILGVSGGCYTIYYTCLIKDDCYDNSGRLITISAGRASLQGVLRNLLLEFSTPQPLRSNLYPVTNIAPGAFIVPHYRPTGIMVFMDVHLTEGEIVVVTKVGAGPFDSTHVMISRRIHSLLTLARVGRPCSHPIDQWLRTNLDPSSKKVRLTGLAPFIGNPGDTVLLYALKGKKFEQLINCQDDVSFWQVCNCLKCAFETMSGFRSPTGASYVYMAG